MWVLKATRTDTNPNTIIVDRDLLVGRHQTADIQLQFPEISRRHAGLSVQGEALILIDLQSSNGTFVNGERIKNETIIHENDKIQFAHLEYSVQQAVIEQSNQNISISEQMNQQGMPSLSERAKDVKITAEGMPQTISIPKPAPIPEGIHVAQMSHDTKADHFAEDMQQQEQKKNVSVGLITVIILIILLAIMGLYFLT